MKQEMKTCSRATCKKTKPVTEFHKAPRTRDGYHTICKACRIKTETARLQAKKAENPELFNYKKKLTQAARRARA